MDPNELHFYDERDYGAKEMSMKIRYISAQIVGRSQIDVRLPCSILENTNRYVRLL